jgi:hypothetical protein
LGSNQWFTLYAHFEKAESLTTHRQEHVRSSATRQMDLKSTSLLTPEDRLESKKWRAWNTRYDAVVGCGVTNRSLVLSPPRQNCTFSTLIEKCDSKWWKPWKPPGSLKAQAKSWSVVIAGVALERSRDLIEAETDKFYWIETLENYLRTDIESGEGTILPGGG